MPLTVTCHACGTAFEWPRPRCTCGEPTWYAYPVGERWPGTTAERMWRFADWLPVEAPEGPQTAVGGTPLVRVPSLDEIGCRVHVKLESANPTGTFKDRGSVVGVAWAAERAFDHVGTVSHGNMAMSVAAAAAASDLGCVVLVPADIPRARLAHIAQFGATIVRVEGSYGELYHESLSIGPDLGVRFVNSDDPLRVAGQGTVGLELAAETTPMPPDAVVVPTSSGGLASGLWRAFRDLFEAGLVSTIPRLYLVQTDAAAPIADAFAAGADRVTAVPPAETVAYSIGNPDPPSGNRALSAARETGGAVVSATDAALIDARRALAREAGLSVEAASAASLAGARRLAEAGELASDDDVVLVATGTGFKEPIDDDVEVPTVPLTSLGPSLEGLLAG